MLESQNKGLEYGFARYSPLNKLIKNAKSKENNTTS
jgi:hypothetical protein